MKALLIAATLASAVLTIAAPLNASPMVSLQTLMQGSFDRHGRGHGCDTPRDIAEHPRCTKP